MSWYLAALRNYFGFSGRARRQEYWYFVLFNLIAGFVFGLVDAMTGTLDSTTGYGLLSGLYTLAVFIPSIAVSMRRLHDSGRTGWWLLIAFIPLIGAIVLLIFMLTGSQDDNEYGQSPKSIDT